MEGTSTASATVKLLEAATPEIVGAVGGAAKATFNATADVIERVFKGREREEPLGETQRTRGSKAATARTRRARTRRRSNRDLSSGILVQMVASL